MTTPSRLVPAERRVGFWAAIATAACCVLFTIAAALTEAHLLSPPWDVVLPIAPSLLLAPAFLAMMVCVNAVTADDRKIWSELGLAFACTYVPLCVAAYIVELFVVEPRVLRGDSAEIALLTLVRGDSVFNAIDGVGYVFMCLATLLAAPAFGATRLERWIHHLFLTNGALALPIFATYFIDRSFMWLAALWSVTITTSAICIAILFRRTPGTIIASRCI